MNTDSQLAVDSATGLEINLAIAGPGARSYAFLIDWHIRLIVAAAWWIAAAFLLGASLTSMGPSENRYIFIAVLPAFANAADFLYGWYHPDAARGSMKRGLYPQIEQAIVAARREIDNRRRTALVQDLQRLIGVQQPQMGLFEGGATVNFDLKWPEAENVGVHTGVSLPQEVYPYYWINEAKKV